MRYCAEVKILGAGNKKLESISRQNLLSLNIAEMKAVQKYFKRLGRQPTDCEIETVAQTWSEHCYHKTFKAEILYVEKAGRHTSKEKIVLFREIMGVTSKLNDRRCISVFKDNAGVARFNGKYGVAFKVETHNHPSALEPYGGAGTGVGGAIRDILGVGKGAAPVLNTDVFCFGSLSASHESLPEGVLHPRRVYKGVVRGVRDYGNRMGIPTGNGAIIFDEGYLNNPLVFCGTLGMIPLSAVEKEVSDKDIIVVAGGRTGRDGIHGATFSSVKLDKDIPTSVVQIGNPVVEKKLLDVILQARDENLYSSVTDCGAGGLSSAVGEMGENTGAVVWLDRVPLKESSLMPWEIWISESQERMVFAVPGSRIERFLQVFASEDVEAAVIGRFEKTGKLKLEYRDEVVCCLDMEFLHKGIPREKLKAGFTVRKGKIVRTGLGSRDTASDVLEVLADPNVASRESVVTQYDHEVQAHTVLKPFVGTEAKGPSDAVVLKPLYSSYRGIAVSCGINPFYGRIDPYYMAGCCIEEALRNAVAVGAAPGEVAILDNFCWGNTGEEEELGALVRCVKGCRDFALAYKLPFISGKDSLNNFFHDKKKNRIASIPGTLLISAVGTVKDIRKISSSDFKGEGNPVYLCGNTREEMGGSVYYRILQRESGRVPRPDPGTALALMEELSRLIERRAILSCHDCSDGGFVSALCEMAIGGQKGADISLCGTGEGVLSPEVLLFSESQGRFIVEVDKKRRAEFDKAVKNLDVHIIGKVAEGEYLKVSGNGKVLFKLSLAEIEEAWRSGLSW